MKERLQQMIESIITAADDKRTFGEIIAEELIANGVIVPPCKVGDTVYAAIPPIFEDDPENGEVDEWRVKGIAYEGDGKWFIESEDNEWCELGDILCNLTREKAEQALQKELICQSEQK